MAIFLNNRGKIAESGFEARNLALTLLIEIEEQSAYANLVVPSRLRDSSLEVRDKAFVTELVYGTLRRQLFYDRVIERSANRSLSKVDSIPLQILRLTAHQLLTLSTRAHAAVDSAVRLTVKNKHGSASGFVNAVSRRISERTLDEWISLLATGGDEVDRLSIKYAHPKWIVEAYLLRLGNIEQVEVELAANNVNPKTTGVIYPGNEWSTETLSTSEPGRWVAAARYLVGNPELLPEIRNAIAGIQDEGSYLVAQALAVVSTSANGIWLDMCAGPGGKAALLSRWATLNHRKFLALELSEHRAALITRVSDAVVVADASRPPMPPNSAAKILLDAPCSGLGALRRRPDARLRKELSQITNLVQLQRRLFTAAVETLAVGGVLAYVTCSPLIDETIGNTKWATEQFSEIELIDARPYFPDEMHQAGNFDIQLWPGLHQTDAMYVAMFRKR